MSVADVAERPVVAVQRPHVRRRQRDCVNFGDVLQQAGAPRRFANTPLPWIDVWCSEHELVDRLYLHADEDSDSPEELAAELAGRRSLACRAAALHARDEHDDDVDRDGWT